MSLERLDRTFARSAHHVSAFLMLGDPDPERSVDLALAAIDAGSTMLELGLPFSDPCADGPAIQASCVRARAAGVSTAAAIDVMHGIHAARPEVPLNLLVYGNLVHAWGYDRFCRSVAAAGGSTLLVPDVPLEESAELAAAIAAHGMGMVSLVGPRTAPARLRDLDAASSGFLYLAGYQGVTGRAGAPPTFDASLRSVLAHCELPICVGFGISHPDHCRAAFDGGARLTVVGSHLARAIEAAVGSNADRDTLLHTLRDALAPLCAVAGSSSRHPTGDYRCS